MTILDCRCCGKEHRVDDDAGGLTIITTMGTSWISLCPKCGKLAGEIVDQFLVVVILKLRQEVKKIGSELWDVAQTAKYLGITINQLYTLCRKRRIIYDRMFYRYWFHKKHLDGWLHRGGLKLVKPNRNPHKTRRKKVYEKEKI